MCSVQQPDNNETDVITLHMEAPLSAQQGTDFK